MFSSKDRDEREIDEYHDECNGYGSSSESSGSESGSIDLLGLLYIRLTS